MSRSLTLKNMFILFMYNLLLGLIIRTVVSQEATDSGETFCPDKHFKCPDNSTCCQLVSKSYGCCPLRSAVCCADHMHCCPSGTHCDVRQSRCIPAEESVSYNWQAIFKEREMDSHGDIDKIISSTNCDDKFRCPQFSNCCGNKEQGFRCCPLKNGICCGIGGYCCPKGFRCNKNGHSCNREEILMDIAHLFLAAEVPSRQIICNDGTVCPQTSQCCPISEHKLFGKIRYNCCLSHETACCGGICCVPGFDCIEQGRLCRKRVIIDD